MKKRCKRRLGAVRAPAPLGQARSTVGDVEIPCLRYEIRCWAYNPKQPHGDISGKVLYDGRAVGKWSATVESSLIEDLIRWQDNLELSHDNRP